MEFLLDVRVDLPGSMPESDRADLRDRELRRGRELRQAGLIKQIWRVPGALRNVAIWDAADATELHEAVTSLPMYPWMSCRVIPLAAHPLQAVEDPADD